MKKNLYSQRIQIHNNYNYVHVGLVSAMCKQKWLPAWCLIVGFAAIQYNKRIAAEIPRLWRLNQLLGT